MDGSLQVLAEALLMKPKRFDNASAIVNAFAEDAGEDSVVEALDAESDDFDADAATAALKEFASTVSEEQVSLIP